MNSDRSGVIVTGAASGLGRATALLLAAANRAVAVWDTNEAGARDTAAECRAAGADAIGMAVDVGDPVAVDAAAAASRRALGPIGALACCAGITRLGPVGNLRIEDWDLTLRINLSGIMYCMEAALPLLREVGRGASIVAVASTEAMRGNPMLLAYTASKHGALGIVRSAARTLGPEGIRVNAVLPGAMDTPMLRSSLAAAPAGTEQQMLASIPLGYASEAAEVGRVIRFLLSSEASYVSGVGIAVDGGMTA